MTTSQYSIVTRVALWAYYTALLCIVTAAFPAILIYALLFDDDNPPRR